MQVMAQGCLKPRPTTEADFELFKSEIARLVEKFGLCEWHVYYDLRPISPHNAQCETNVISRSCTMVLNTRIALYTDEEMKDTAAHEVSHLILADVVDLGGYRWVSKDEFFAASERVARKIQNLLRGK
jgi:hypothetical protein